MVEAPRQEYKSPFRACFSWIIASEEKNINVITGDRLNIRINQDDIWHQPRGVRAEHHADVKLKNSVKARMTPYNEEFVSKQESNSSSLKLAREIKTKSDQLKAISPSD